MKQYGVRYFPIALFSSVMGLAALTIVLRHFITFHQLFSGFYITFATLTSLLLVINGGIFIYRFFAYQREWQQDVKHPLKMNFLATISISFLLVAIIYEQNFSELSFILWVIGAVLQLIITFIVIHRTMWNDTIKLNHFTPISFIPIVGHLVVALSGSAHVDLLWNGFFFGIGLFFSIIYTALLLYRLFFTQPLPPPLVPTLFIFLAPPSVGLIAYLNLGYSYDLFAQILYAIAIFFALLLLLQLPRIFKDSFFISAWAMLFPSGALTIATVRIYFATEKIIFKGLSFGLLIWLFVLLIYLLGHTVRLVRNGALFMPES